MRWRCSPGQLQLHSVFASLDYFPFPQRPLFPKELGHLEAIAARSKCVKYIQLARLVTPTSEGGEPTVPRKLNHLETCSSPRNDVEQYPLPPPVCSDEHVSAQALERPEEFGDREYVEEGRGGRGRRVIAIVSDSATTVLRLSVHDLFHEYVICAS